jgi:hypothetical protein
MKTIRKSASLKKATANLIGASGFLGTFLVLKLFEPELSQHTVNPKLVFLLFAPFFIGFIVRFLIQLSIKCPACGGDIAPTVMSSGSPFAVSKKMKFCPCCGADFDGIR